MFKIGDFSRLTQVSVRMLRYYDELGLLKPAEVDRFTGYRLYSSRQIGRLNKIITLRDMGFLTAEIEELLLQDMDDVSLIKILRSKEAQLRRNIACENTKLLKLQNFMDSVGKENMSMNYEVTIKEVPSYKVVSKRGIIQAYDREGQLWRELGEFAGNNSIKCGDICFAIYHDQEYKEKDVDVEVVMSVEQLQKDRDGFTFRETEPVGQMASLMVAGPFENISPAFNALAEWVENNGFVPAGPSRQICHKGPWCESNPENYLTEIQYPVRKAMDRP